MSLLIELPESAEEPPGENMFQILLQQVGALLYHPEFHLATLAHQENQSVHISLPRGQLAFVRNTHWNLTIKNKQLQVCITALEHSGVSFMRAQSERMKIQLMILLRLINNNLPIEENYFVAPDSGILKYTFIMGWKEYRQKLKGPDPLRKLFRYILSQLNLYAEVILFCEPQSHELQVGQSMHHGPPDIEKINRYRFLLRNTRKFRESNITFFGQVMELKERLRKNPNDPSSKLQLDQLRSLFQNNIMAFDQLRLGLEDEKKETMDGLKDCLQHVKKNADGSESRPPQTNIVSGIQILKQHDVKTLSKEGAHSQIMKGKFMYKLYKTINFQLMSNKAWTDGKQHKGQLIFKSCNLQEKSSINSFLNQLYLLNYIRDSKSSYIAKYYLQVKPFQKRSEKDNIYMRSYFHNMYAVLKKCKSISFDERLRMSYKISKGLCFLTSKSILHRDLKPPNILIDQYFNPFIIDFGSCAPIYRENTFKVHEDRLLTTPLFHVYYHEIPEEFSYLCSKFTREEYNRHPLFDVYSFGRVLSFLFFNSLAPPNPDELFNYPYPDILKNILFIISMCLQIDPDERPTFSQIASFLGSLNGYISMLPKSLEQRSRPVSQPKPVTKES